MEASRAKSTMLENKCDIGTGTDERYIGGDQEDLPPNQSQIKGIVVVVEILGVGNGAAGGGPHRLMFLSNSGTLTSRASAPISGIKN